MYSSLPNFVKITIIEGEKIFIFILETLDGMRDTFREVPDIPHFQFVNLKFTVLINSRNDDAASINKSPFSLEYSQSEEH